MEIAKSIFEFSVYVFGAMAIFLFAIVLVLMVLQMGKEIVLDDLLFRWKHRRENEVCR